MNKNPAKKKQNTEKPVMAKTLGGADSNQPSTQSSFKLIVPNDSLTDVGDNWGKTDITVGGGWVIQGTGSGDNMVISGLTEGSSYKISVYVNGKVILVKCDKE